MVKSRILLIAGAVAALALPAAASAGEKLKATLAGAAEEGGGDAKGSGTFTAEVDADSGDFCYTLVARTSDKPVAAHVHAGAAGASGPPVLTIMVTGPGTDECLAAEPDKLKEILAAPENFYVNVHTATFPKGAVRGPLSK